MLSFRKARRRHVKNEETQKLSALVRQGRHVPSQSVGETVEIQVPAEDSRVSVRRNADIQGHRGVADLVKYAREA